MRLEISAAKIAVEVRETFICAVAIDKLCVPKSKLILIWLALSIWANKSFIFSSSDFFDSSILWLAFPFLLYLDKSPFVHIV